MTYIRDHVPPKELKKMLWMFGLDPRAALFSHNNPSHVRLGHSRACEKNGSDQRFQRNNLLDKLEIIESYKRHFRLVRL